MQVPKRKPGKYTHMKVDTHMRQEKFNELASKLEGMKKTHPQLAEDVKTYAQFGDFSENAEYQIAKGKLRGLNSGMLKIENLLKNAVIINPPKTNETIQLGSTITSEINGKQKRYLILGALESDPANGIISHSSPIGSALIGHRVGDVVRINLGEREVEHKIIKIE